MDVPVAPDLLEALEAVLPEDAPAGHEAWQKVKRNKNPHGPLCYFIFGSQRLQTTLLCCLTEEAMLRVARACYVKFSEGEPKERVLEFRAQVYARIKGLKGGRDGDAAADPPKKKRRAAATSDPPAGPRPQGAEEGVAAAASGAPAGSPHSEASRSVPRPAALPATALSEDAPAGHQAWGRVYHEQSRGIVRLYLNTLKRPGLERYTTTVKNSGGSAEAALRIARLCYIKFSEGASKEEVNVYRQSHYDAHNPRAAGGPVGEPRARKAARAGAAGNEGDTLEAAKRELKAQGRLEGSLVVEGRSLEKKNASINGLYARRAEDHDGHGAYEKVGAAAAVRPRFLYYWREKSRWKIDSSIPSGKSGFAYLKAAGAASPAQAGLDFQWHVCDDRGEGYGKDPGVRCYEAEATPGAAVPAAKKAGHPATAAGALPSWDNSASGDSSSSSSSSSDDAGDQTSGDEESGSASGAASPARPGAAAGAADRQVAGAAPARACAKMLVRSGLRCVCHFRMVRDCPGRP